MVEAKVIHKISYENLTMIIESMVAKQFKNPDYPITVDEFTEYLRETPEKEYVLFGIVNSCDSLVDKPWRGEVKGRMANLEMTVHLNDLKEVERLVECSGDLVKIIEGNNFVNDAGFLLKWAMQYHNFRSALIDLAEATKNRSQSASLETV